MFLAADPDFRKQPEAINEWSLDNVNLCSTRQKRIIADSINCLKPGGVLIYSTCSYSIEEDEVIVEWMIKEFDLEYIPLPINKEWNIIETSFGYRSLRPPFGLPLVEIEV